MSYDGIDYGRGMTNLDHATGIRFGVIHQHTIGAAWFDDAEPQYGDPTCPTCGGAAREAQGPADYAGKSGTAGDYVCDACQRFFWAEDAFSETPLAFTLATAEITAEQHGDDGDIFVTKSIYYSRGTFCSPCAPGAVSLGTDGGIKAYCFGHDWFEDGRAPYRVFRVADDTEVQP